jgi:quercetin dioxygenase-like cupin family protein
VSQAQAPALAAAPRMAAPAAPRVDLYSAIHKALRLAMADTLSRLGRLDTDDAAECSDVLAQLDALLDACRSHVAKENQYVHTAIEARRPGASQRVAGEHVEHLDAIAALQAETAALRALPGAPAALRLYRRLALFVADNLEHMHLEETQHNALLWAAYSDAELLEIHQRILAAIEPAEMAQVLRWMVPAASPAERAAMLGAMQQQMPPEAMRGVLEAVRPHLDRAGWDKLARALNLPAAARPQPFVVTPADYPPALGVVGTRITVLAGAQATQAHEVTLQQGDDGMGPPPHSHPWHESFFVTRGEVIFECAGRTIPARAGTLVHVPAGTVHAFRFGREGGAMVEIAGAGGQATAMFGAVAAQFPPGPPALSDLPRLVGVLQQHGVSVAA